MTFKTTVTNPQGQPVAGALVGANVENTRITKAVLDTVRKD